MPETTAVAIINEYPPNKYNTLIPVKSIQEIGPLHRVIVNEVQIESNPDKKDVYKEKSGEYALTKKGLAKLMAAGNVQVLDSRSVLPKKCERCYMMAQATRTAPKCFECPCTDDIAHQVTIAVPQPDGTMRVVKGTKEIRMADSKGSMTDGQFKQFKPFASEHCETKALNRALREGLMVQSTYKQDDLLKPFVVAMVVPNFSDPQLKEAMIERYKRSEGALFGGPTRQLQEAVPILQSLPDGRTVDVGTGEVHDDDDTAPSFEHEGSEEPTCTCGDCGQPIQEWTDAKTGKVWTPEMTVDFTQTKLGGDFCSTCAFERIKQAAQARKEA